MFLSKTNYLLLFFKWILICLIVGILAGASSSLFLYTLNVATDFREAHLWMVFLLPIAGLATVICIIITATVFQKETMSF